MSATTREAEARARKATRLAAGCRAQGIDSDTASRLDQAGRDALAGLYECRSPSPKTWALVLDLLEESESLHASARRSVRLAHAPRKPPVFIEGVRMRCDCGGHLDTVEEVAGTMLRECLTCGAHYEEEVPHR